MPLRFQNTAGVEITAHNERQFEFTTSGPDDQLRIVIDIPPVAAQDSLDIDVELDLLVEQGTVTHLSLVNGSVSEGRMFDLPAGTGNSEVFTIGGVFRPFASHALLLLLTQGATRGKVTIKRTTIAPVRIPEKMRVLFFIEPWIERDNAFWKQIYLPWFDQQAQALKQAHPGYEFLAVGNESFEYGLAAQQVGIPFRGIAQASLLSVFPSSRDAISAWCNGTASANATREMQRVVKRTLGDFEPDVVIATAPAPYLQSLYPRALQLYTDGFHFRPPWPDATPMFDPSGCLRGTVTESMARETDVDPSAAAFMNRYRAIVDRDADALNAFVANRLKAIRQRFDKVVVLALQEIQFFNIFTVHPFGTQVDYFIDAMEKIDPKIGVIVAQHPDRRDLDPETLGWLKTKYPNVIADPYLDQLRAPSQALMPHVDGLVTTSSGLIYQAAIRHKPAFLTHPTHFSALSHTRPLQAINTPREFSVDTARVDTQMAWILRHHAFNHSFMLHTNWLHDRLARLWASKSQKKLSWRSMPRIASDAIILDWLPKHLRPGVDATPPVEQSVEMQERKKYEKMYSRPEYHGNDSVIGTARTLVEQFQIEKPTKVMDVGCGPGSASLFLKKAGHDVIAIDIASNCLDPDKRGAFPLLIACIWELPDFVKANVFLCSDVMEHIPTEQVAKTLEKISHACDVGGIFVISLRPDDCGRLIGETLHLTVQSLQWWQAELGKYWKKVDVVQHNEQEQHATFKVSHG